MKNLRGTKEKRRFVGAFLPVFAAAEHPTRSPTPAFPRLMGDAGFNSLGLPPKITGEVDDDLAETIVEMVHHSLPAP